MKEIRVFNRSLHRELWQWLAENPEAAKGAWPGWQKCGGVKHSGKFFYCFACASTGYGEVFNTITESVCAHCPLDWDNDDYPCWWDDEFSSGLFIEFNDACSAHCWSDAAGIALRIRDLPVREDPNYITIII